ncbi:MAG: ATP-binding protein, partial [Methanocalculus sp. MSAO_Arc2]|uniref:AAA family ATPase n=1 Tax=Methanocalculus sp. MSAO_Arc2 TaxID=2293855 RepID=UPI000FEDD485
VDEERRGVFFLNFEDPRLAEFELKDIALLEEVFYEEFGEKDLYYFDEIQNLPGWESYVRYLLDRKKKVIITGSNASLLSRDLRTN